MVYTEMSFTDIAQDQAVRNWMGDLGEQTKGPYLWHFEKFIKWVRENDGKFAEMSPAELVEFALDASTRDLNELLDLKKKYLQSMTGGIGHKRNSDKAIKSFFLHNRATLPPDVTLNIKADTPKVEKDLEAVDIKNVVLSSNKTYQAVFLTMLGGGFGQEEFVSWSDTGLADLRDQLRRGVDPVKVKLHGRKGMKMEYNYFTYASGDALDALKRYMAIRDRIIEKSRRRAEGQDRPYKEPDSIFINQRGLPLNKAALYWYWMRQLKRLGIIDPDNHDRGGQPRYGKHLHQFRTVFRTLWRKSGVEVEFAEYHMGHEKAFDDYGYDVSQEDEPLMQSKYRAALPYLNIITDTKAYDLVDRNTYENEKIAGLEAELKRMKEQQEETLRILKKLTEGA